MAGLDEAGEFAVVVEFAQLDAGYQRRAREAQERGRDALVVDASKMYLLALDRLYLRAEDSQQLLHCLFAWSFAQIFYLNKFNAKNQEFAQLVSHNYPVDGPPEPQRMLALGQFARFREHVEQLAQSIPQAEAKRALRDVCKLLEGFNVFYRPTARSTARDRLDFASHIAFQRQRTSELADRCAAVLADSVNELSIEHGQALSTLIGHLHVLRGDLPAVHAHFQHDLLQLCSAFLLYVNPLCEEHDEASLLKVILEQRSAALTEGPFNQLVLRGVEHCENAFEFLRAAEGLCPPWLVFHLGKLLLHAGAVLFGKQFAPPRENLEYLAERYLDYLVRLRADFATFWQYYAQVYDLEGGVQVDLLKRAVCVNLRYTQMRDFLEQRGREAVVEAVLADVLASEEFCRSVDFANMLAFLKYAENVSVVNKLFAALLRADTPAAEKLLLAEEALRQLPAQPAKGLYPFHYRLFAQLCKMQVEAEGGREAAQLVEELSSFLELTALKYYPLTAQALQLARRLLGAGVALPPATASRLRLLLQFVKAYEHMLPGARREAAEGLIRALEQPAGG